MGEIPRLHSISELLGILAKRLEEQDHPREADPLASFVREYRDALIDIESAYAESRYGMATATHAALNSMKRVAEKLFNLMEEMEVRVLGQAPPEAP